MQIEAGYVVEVGLEAGSTTETLLSTVQVVTQHHRQRVGVIVQPGKKGVTECCVLKLAIVMSFF